jgi:hypothetical protein
VFASTGTAGTDDPAAPDALEVDGVVELLRASPAVGYAVTSGGGLTSPVVRKAGSENSLLVVLLDQLLRTDEALPAVDRDAILRVD